MKGVIGSIISMFTILVLLTVAYKLGSGDIYLGITNLWNVVFGAANNLADAIVKFIQS